MDMVTKKPDVAPTEVSPKTKRRIYSPAFKRQILEEADAVAGEYGKVTALLRRNGLYSSHLTEWRRARDTGVLPELMPLARGPAPAAAPTEAELRVRELEQQLTRMTLRAERAEMLVTLQKKLVGLFSTDPTPDDETP
jgi:transposase-like protein